MSSYLTITRSDISRPGWWIWAMLVVDHELRQVDVAVGAAKTCFVDSVL